MFFIRIPTHIATRDGFWDNEFTVSYRDDEIPNIDELKKMMQGFGKTASVYSTARQDALSTKKSKEMLLVGI